MRIKLLGCVSTMNDVKRYLPPVDIDEEYLNFDYHAVPANLHQELQARINASQDYDLIILTYGRCSNSITGLVSPKVPILYPDVHDCISFILGNEQRQGVSAQNPGTYYFSQGWLDFGKDPYAEYLEYLDKYGESSARFLIDSLYGHYSEVMLILTPAMENIAKYREKVQRIASFFGWTVKEMEGDMTVLASLVKTQCGNGLVRVEPGQPID